MAVLAARRSAVGSTILIATARSLSSAPSAEPPSSGLSLSVAPLHPHERTKTFQRPVAIKRLSSKLLRNGELVTPFLEAARGVTAMRHANVCQVHEVGHSGDDVYLVMDYMMGETVASLMRQLQSLGETLDFTMAAYIIAEACAGLEAAHALGILHERLTPRDLFIGYDGTVKVIDVGIAAARARMVGDLEPGGLELQYSSPESCKKETLDARSDVFSLGAILWELNTGISPFERAKEADTIRAICEEGVASPGNVLRGLPEDVSRVTLKALAREKEKRYASASALRQPLLAMIRRLGMGASPTDDLGNLMRRLFEKRVRDKSEMLKRIVAGKSLAGLDVREADDARAVHDDTPSVIIRPPSSPELVAPIAPPLTASPAVLSPESLAPDALVPDDLAPASLARARRNNVLYGVLAMVALSIGASALVIGLRSAESAPRSVPTNAPTPSGTVASDVSAASVTPSTSATTAEETVLHIETVPAHAMIFIDGAKRGVAPLDLNLPKSGDAVIVELRYPGFQTLKERVVPDVNQKLKLTLLAARGPTTTTTTASAPPYHKFE